jgi:hypothetical protein
MLIIDSNVHVRSWFGVLGLLVAGDRTELYLWQSLLLLLPPSPALDFPLVSLVTLIFLWLQCTVLWASHTFLLLHFLCDCVVWILTYVSCLVSCDGNCLILLPLSGQYHLINPWYIYKFAIYLIYYQSLSLLTLTAGPLGSHIHDTQ